MSKINEEINCDCIQEREWLREAEQHLQYLLDDPECELYRDQAQEFLWGWKERKKIREIK